MTHGAKLTLKYDSKFEYTGTYYGDDILPEEHITMEIPAEDLNTMQLFRFFSNFLRSIGHNEYGIMKGACNLAFNEMNNEDDMKKLAHEFDLVMEEHIGARIKVYEELAENWEKRYWDLRRNMHKQQIEDCMPPWGHSDLEYLANAQKKNKDTNKNGFWKYEEDKTLKEVEQYLSSTYHSHYTSEQSKTQTLDLIESIGDAEAFTRSNAIKYLSRFGKKNGKSKMDILKAIHYCILLYHFAGLHKNTTSDFPY